jgi:hippurate hydrolase
VELLGTFRTMNEKWRYEAHEWIKNFTINTCNAWGAKATVDIPKGYPSLFNDPALTANAENWATAYLGADKVHTLDMRMAGEDFSFYALEIPGCFFRIGTNRDNSEFLAPVHNAHFDIDEQAMETGMGLMAWFGLNALRLG